VYIDSHHDKRYLPNLSKGAAFFVLVRWRLPACHRRDDMVFVNHKYLNVRATLWCEGRNFCANGWQVPRHKDFAWDIHL